MCQFGSAGLTDRSYRGDVDELADSSELLHDAAGLRGRLAEAGYLFFRGLLPAEPVRTAGATVLARLRDGGWTDTSGTPAAHPRRIISSQREGYRGRPSGSPLPEGNQRRFVIIRREGRRR